MSKEYIERKGLIEDCDATISNIQFTSPYQDDIEAMVSGMERIRDMVDEAPAADVAPVVHGRWYDEDSFDFHGSPIYRCSVCNKTVADDYISFHKYCLHCGARMDGGNSNDL